MEWFCQLGLKTIGVRRNVKGLFFLRHGRKIWVALVVGLR
jgi:hypothetical protein